MKDKTEEMLQDRLSTEQQFQHEMVSGDLVYYARELAKRKAQANPIALKDTASGEAKAV